MLRKKESALARRGAGRDPFGLMRQMTTELDRLFDEGVFPTFAFPALGQRKAAEAVAWLPDIDVFEKDNRLVTKIDLPGMKKEDVAVEVADGQLSISGERKSEAEEKQEGFYRCERQYGSFYRTIPLPEGVQFEDIKARFTDGVLEVSVPLPVKAADKPRKVAIEPAPATTKTAA